MEPSSGDKFAIAPVSTSSTNVHPSIRPPALQIDPETGQVIEIQDSEDESSHFSDFGDFADIFPRHMPIGRISGMGTMSNFSSIPNRKLIVPKSRYSGYTPPLPMYKERVAVAELLEEIEKPSIQVTETKDSSDGKEFDQIELSDFTIYLPGSLQCHPYEMRGLQYLFLRSHSLLLFDGILSVGGSQRYVQGVPFKICSIGNYGEEHHSVGSNMWIQSDLNGGSDIYYQLTSPSTEYMRFHEGFSWLADLAKHFVDYCQASAVPISVHAFRSDFSQWIRKSHQDSVAFQQWYGAYQNDDFRLAICRNIDFLFKESIGIDEKLRSHPIWSELLNVDFVKNHSMKETKTIVTPYVYECFSHLKFGYHLKALEPVEDVESKQASLGRALHLTVTDASMHGQTEEPNLPADNLFVERADYEANLVLAAASNHERRIRSMKVGDVVSVNIDAGSTWRDEISRWKVADECWYFLIQELHTNRVGKISFHGIWLYKSSDTSCAKMKYPFSNELFLSDNCTCGEARIPEAEVLDVVKVNWYGHPSTSNQKLFVRQTYLENERFVTLREEHKTCTHFRSRNSPRPSKATAPEFSVGQTVLARPPAQRKSKYELEVYEILEFLKGDTGTHRNVLLRQLQRRSGFDGKGRPNELVYTNVQDMVPEAKIYSSCLVRCFDEKESIPAPYNRDGAGNAFYITQRRIAAENGEVKLTPLETCPEILIQGFSPDEGLSRKKLRGMDLYCGGGNFGRGLEEGGAVENCYAVDLDRAAIHTYNANLQPQSATKLFFGSVNDLLKAAMRGNPKNIDSVPLPGDVDFISAGSPCQGFSMLNSHKNNDKSLKNQSLVASVAAYVDFYRPRYGLLENVISMAQKGRGRDEDVLSQLVCALVGMGYQTQLILGDAWSSGSPQSRSRLFVSFAAPDMEPLEYPALSHSHPPKTIQRGLGRLANGESFGSRNLDILTPFNYVTAKESVKDLPVIGDGMMGHCLRFPDHILEYFPSEALRRQLHAIPLYPRGSSFAGAWNGGLGTMSKEDRLLFPADLKANGTPRSSVQPISKGWARADPNKLFGTITTTVNLVSSRGAAAIHWDENRALSLMEYRRAQSFPDDEIILGNRSQCMRIIGNSVARTVALSLGLALREAWLKSKPYLVSFQETAVECSLEDDKEDMRQSSRITQRAKSTIIPDSTETSDDELSMDYMHHFSVPDLRQALEAVPVYSLASQSESPASSQPVALKTDSLKRSYSASEDVRGSLEGSRKAPRLSSLAPVSQHAMNRMQ